MSDLGADQRQCLESALGVPLAEDQRVLIMVLNPGEPDESIRARALSRLEQLCEKGTRNGLSFFSEGGEAEIGELRAAELKSAWSR
ncbi:MAG: hypothetical protein HYS13_18770 [Planctomycetia bacterium]|nr:hypothetical protein [Planctomycetia bacterium]